MEAVSDRLGRYVVLKHLASGGMADVLLARTDGIEGFTRHVVLKRIRAEHAKDQRFIDMFLDEARLAANLHHQNVVQVHDIGESAGDYFFAMEYLHGEDVRSMLSKVAKSKTHMPLGHVVAIVASVAAGLHYAHERRGADKKPLNIVHRDVSPSNIIVGYDGSVKIVDFGIAKAAMRQVETQAGSLKGKVSYMSPEHCKGEPIDRRSDVYALGVVLYELATTTRLFKGDNDYLVMDAICNGKIPLPRVRRSGLPNELAMIIMTALATEPDRRYQTADEMRQALEHFAVKQQITANAGALATYLVKQFGERAEPWLDITASERKTSGSVPTVANGDHARSWTELPVSRDVSADGDDDNEKTTTGGRSLRANPVGAVSQPAIIASTRSRVEDRTSSRMAWEHEGAIAPPPVPAARPNLQKIAMFAAPALLVIVLLAWKLASGGSHGDQVAAASLTPAEGTTVMPVAATPPPAPPEMMEKTIVRPDPVVAAAPAVVAAAPVVVAAAAPAVVAPKVTAPKPAPARPAPVKIAAAKPEPMKVVVSETPEPPKPAIVVTKPIEPPPPVVAAPAPVPVPAPAPIEPQVAKLSQGSVAGVASQHRRELSKCEGTDQLHGEITVNFAVNGAGRVVKSQLSSTLKNPKVSGCILRTLQSWQFPKPGSGAAEGSYSMSYQ
ncbi:hypothetical protein BH11MYX3_BH11MYX3_46360 [soil metagenome]